MRTSTNKTMLNLLLDIFFKSLEEANISYCIIGNYENLPSSTTNDVDFWVDDIGGAEKILLSLAEELELSLYMQNKTAVGTNNYFYYTIDNSIEVVKIDLMNETAYKSVIPIVSSDLIKKNREKYNSFVVANSLIEGIMHLLYSLITFGVVKQKYREKVFRLSKTLEYKNLIVDILGYKLGESIIADIQNEDWSSVEKSAPRIKRYLIQKTFFNLTFKRFHIMLNFIGCILTRLINKNGIVVSFTGIDGAGKTSIKEHLIENSDRYFSKGRKREFYWRPFLLPRIAQVVGSKGQIEVLDNSGKRVVGSSFSSHLKNMIKYFYYVADFVLGQSKYFKQSHTGGLVVFDRYHFDNIIYPERFGFKLNKKVMRFFDKYIIPKPDIMFYFTAGTDVLYERKHEIDIDEINRQKTIYTDEMGIRKDIVTINTDGPFNDSVKQVLSKCFELMSSRYN